MHTIHPCLWFDHQAEEAAQFYVGIFKDSRVLRTTHYLESAHKPAGTVLTVVFELDGTEFTALNGGPEFPHTPAVSFVVKCEDQAEVDYYWDKLSAGGKIVECGWLTDRYGVSWQVVPTTLLGMIASADTAAARRAVEAMYKMKKLDIAALEKAFRGD